MSWAILLFFLMYPWKYTTVNLLWEMAVTHDFWVSQGEETFYHGKRTMCNRNYIFSWDSIVSFASLCVFTYTYPVSFLLKCHRKEPQRSSCHSNIFLQKSSCAFIKQWQRRSCGFQDSSSSDLESAARRTSCGCKKKFLRVHYYFLGCTVLLYCKGLWAISGYCTL